MNVRAAKPLALSTTLLLAASGLPAMAEYPDRPITFVVSASPGGGTDIGVRTYAPYLEKCLGTTLTIDYKPGAQNKIGFREVARAQPDGYTIGSIAMPNLVTAQLDGDADFAVDSFDYLGSFFSSTTSWNVRKDSPYNSLTELIDAHKKNNQQITLGIGGIGADDHLLGLKVMKVGGLDMRFIPFGDDALSRNALLGGHVDIVSMGVNQVMPFKDEVKTLAVSGKERVKELPDTPTFAEQGFALEGGTTHIVSSPKGIPADVQAKLAECIKTVSENPAFIAEAEKRALGLHYRGGDDVKSFIQNEFELLSDLAKTNPWKQ